MANLPELLIQGQVITPSDRWGYAFACEHLTVEVCWALEAAWLAPLASLLVQACAGLLEAWGEAWACWLGQACGLPREALAEAWVSLKGRAWRVLPASALEGCSWQGAPYWELALKPPPASAWEGLGRSQARPASMQRPASHRVH